ncbi:MAG: glycosyltransferase [Bacteroidales bacterium]|nr:glycosyltransferase [Lachnoclostridium sp.]MCM1383940.1 glycosyltransferase [Lachnoclostridium sp.]MCM1464649.1 glycosyltransferase [Bacteroidales bacterium]
MWDNIKEEIEQGNFIQARALLEEEKELRGNCPDDTFAILDASVCEAEGDREGMFDAIAAGLSFRPSNYELYYMLGNYYLAVNPNQAFLCFENALYYCHMEEDRQIIRAQMEELKQSFDIVVQNTVIIIVSYNSCYLMQKNIESIRNTLLKGTYQIVAVDNASEDGVAKWLEEQEDVILVQNKENMGFAHACNQGAKIVEGTKNGNSDIFLLNNDARLAPNSLFWLRMGLYEDKRTGAVGACSNYAGNEQQLEISLNSPGEYVNYGAKINLPMRHPYEERVRLSGFAMLVKRSAWDSAGGMDERFTPGYFEDDDLCMKIMQGGFRMLYCRNSFIYHAGSQSFSRKKEVDEILASHHRLFMEKWGFDILEYAYPDKNLSAQMTYHKEEEFNVLQVGCGLGADLKLLHARFPKAHMVGLELNPALCKAAGETEIVFPSVQALSETFQTPVFQVLIINPEAYRDLSEEERNSLFRLCRKDCCVLPGQNPYEGLNFDRVKLIIWDLDDTFWQGTLSEGNVSVLPEHIELLKHTADLGILHSISSKNDASQVYDMLEQLQIRSLFVFNDINWEDKGVQIKRKITDMGLRAENVLFIDDNVRNLEEAKHCCGEIMTALPDVIPYLANYAEGLPPLDRGHKRLAQYKLLEKKTNVREQFDSKEDFLTQSDIRVFIGHDCLKELDRITELVGRTNQLNFTKQRSSREELLRMISNDWMDCGYVRVKDKYGDYGIVGFYCYNRQEQRLVHFLFSCRILGMKVEQYIYDRLGSPAMEIVPPTACALEENIRVPWISEAEWEDSIEKSEDTKDSRIKILLKGPCDMSAIETYLAGGKITTEFNYVNAEGFITTGQNHSMHLWESAHCSEEELSDMLREVPFLTHGDFETLLFQNKYHIICYSLLPDCHAGLYRNKKTGRYISFGSVNFDLTDERNMAGYIDGTIVNHAFPFTEEIIREFSKKWEFVGTTSGEDLLRNLEYMYYHAPGEPKFVLLLGSETEYEGENAEFANHAERHKAINALVKDFAADKPRMKWIAATDFIHSQEDYEDCINHFSRDVYYHLAGAVCSCINEWFGK